MKCGNSSTKLKENKIFRKMIIEWKIKWLKSIRLDDIYIHFEIYIKNMWHYNFENYRKKRKTN